MRVLKKIGKTIAVLFLVLILGLVVLDFYLIKNPEIQAKRKIDGIDEVACGIQELTVRENAKIIGLGEATHGNAEFQELKLKVLKVLVDQ